MDDGDLIDVVGVVVVDGWVGAAVWAVAMDVAKVSACHRPRSSRRILLLTVMLNGREERKRFDTLNTAGRGREKILLPGRLFF